MGSIGWETELYFFSLARHKHHGDKVPDNVETGRGKNGDKYEVNRKYYNDLLFDVGKYHYVEADNHPFNDYNGKAFKPKKKNDKSPLYCNCLEVVSYPIPISKNASLSTSQTCPPRPKGDMEVMS